MITIADFNTLNIKQSDTMDFFIFVTGKKAFSTDSLRKIATSVSGRW